MTQHPAALQHWADMKMVIGHIMDLQRRIYSPDLIPHQPCLSAKTIGINHIPRPPLKMNHTAHALQQQRPKRHNRGCHASAYSAGRIVSWIIYCWLVWCERKTLFPAGNLRSFTSKQTGWIILNVLNSPLRHAGLDMLFAVGSHGWLGTRLLGAL